MSSEVHVSITPRGMSVTEAYRLFREDSLLVNRRYQRKLVWSVAEKQLLIDSILDGYPIPLILLAERPEIHGSGKYEIIDGMQRLDAIFAFIEQKFEYNGMHFDLGQSARARQAAAAGAFKPVDAGSLLPADKCANLVDYQLAVTIFPTQTEGQITDVFSRINSNGRQLSAQEKRQAGMLNQFSELVRTVASSLRGDVSDDVVLLHDMPSISIESSRENQQYGVRAEDTVWIRHGILNVKQLREGDDEQMVADISASILSGIPFPASKEEFDEIYDSQSEKHKRLERTLAAYGGRRLQSEIQSTFSVLTEVIDSQLAGPNGLRNLVRPGGGNPIRTPFYAIFMSFFELIVRQQKSPDDNAAIVKAIRNVGPRLKSARHYTSAEDRTSNIDMITGLIQKHFVAKVPPVFGHGPGLALDFENSLRRSKIETSRYEFKQGVLRLDARRVRDDGLFVRLAETICGIANVQRGHEGYLFIGVADKESDVKRVENLDSVTAVPVGRHHHVVGVDREAKILKMSLDAYVQRFVTKLSQQPISEPLATQILSGVDTIEYKGLSVIRVLIPGQSDLSYCGDRVFIRRGSSTESVTEVRKIAALAKGFS
ncbi:GmrSD restriction endonuclease domain-containing protein [Streptomyces rubiginosohelvolus]|uniref:GmrSD restriction endonuclease domain-containing protein n=1 Tax=Streptomyces rubiginosohelvolus TaxID=67362 RepID=UPI0033B4B106